MLLKGSPEEIREGVPKLGATPSRPGATIAEEEISGCSTPILDEGSNPDEQDLDASDEILGTSTPIVSEPASDTETPQEKKARGLELEQHSDERPVCSAAVKKQKQAKQNITRDRSCMMPDFAKFLTLPGETFVFDGFFAFVLDFCFGVKKRVHFAFSFS